MTFDQVYDAYFEALFRFLRRMGIAPSDLEDICHEVFLVFHRKAELVTVGREKAFLLGIAYRIAADYRRLRRHDGVAFDDRTHGHLEGDAESVYATRSEIVVALRALPDERRVVLLLHDFEGLSAPEIAENLAIPLNTVYSRIRLARADFNQAIASNPDA